LGEETKAITQLGIDEKQALGELVRKEQEEQEEQPLEQHIETLGLERQRIAELDNQLTIGKWVRLDKKIKRNELQIEKLAAILL